jgi:uncharacterized coiled-coil protein SlyX
MTERLDRIEATLASIAELMATGRREHDARMAQHDARMAQHDAQIANINKIVESNARAIAETRSIVDSNARAIEANSNALAENADEIARQRAELRNSIEDMVSMVSTMAQQAESDRIEFRAYVQSILDALTTRFNSNGHSD